MRCFGADLVNIRTGYGTDDIHIGTALSAAEALLGSPPYYDVTLGRCWGTWRTKETKELLVSVAASASKPDLSDYLVYEITFYAKGAKTGDGIEIGKSFPMNILEGDSDSKLFELPDQRGKIVNFITGTAFIVSMDKNHICQEIIVFQRGKPTTAP